MIGELLRCSHICRLLTRLLGGTDMTTAYAAFVEFTRLMMESRDLDNEYRVMRHLGHNEPRERQLWLTALYLAYVNLPSALAVWDRYPDGIEDPSPLKDWRLPIGTERRGLRPRSRLVEHLTSYRECWRPYGSQERWLIEGFGSDPVHNFAIFWERAQTIEQNGRWAAFKWAEL